MVRCPKCNRTYENDSQKFCTRDGGRLTPIDEGANYDPNSTIVGGNAFDPGATMVSGAPNPNPNVSQPSFDPNATIISPTPPTPQPSSPSANTDPQMFQTIAGTAPPNFPAANPAPPANQSFSPPEPQSSTADIPPSSPAQNPAASQSGIPMPARYDASAPTSSDLKSPGASTGVTSGNLGASGVAPPQQTYDNFGYTTGQSTAPPSGNSNYPQGGSSGQTSAGLRPPDGMMDMQTQALVSPSGESYKTPNTGELDASSVSMPSSEPATAAQPQTPPVVAAPVQKKSSSKKMLFLGLGAMFFALLVVVVGAGVFVMTQHPEWIGMGGKTNNNENTNTGNNENTNTTNPNTNDSPNTNTNTNTNENTNTSSPPPPNSTQFVNSSSGLSGDLASHFTPFSFYYSQTWKKFPNPEVFTQVVRQLPDGFPQEQFAAGYYESKGTIEADRADFAKIAQTHETRLSKDIPGYKKLSEGETTINGISGYEIRFTGDIQDKTKGDVKFFGRMVLLPPGKESEKNGVKLLMVATSLAPEVQGIDDVGVKGELPVILNSFKLGQ